MNERRPLGAETSKSHHKDKYNQKNTEGSFRGRKRTPIDSKEQKYGSRSDGDRNKDGRFPPKEGKFRAAAGKYHGGRNVKSKGKQTKPWEVENAAPIISDLQVTDGKHRGKYLKCGTSPKARQTDGRIREAMFKILFRRIKAGRFLDLCAGSGTVGIEAISRGALISTFVERSAKMCSLIRKNMESLEIKDGHGEVFEIEVIPFLKKMAKRRRNWDVVYFDPPYDSDYDEVLDCFARGAALKPQGVLVIHHPAEMFFSEKIGVIRRWRVVVQGDSALSFYDRK